MQFFFQAGSGSFTPPAPPEPIPVYGSEYESTDGSHLFWVLGDSISRGTSEADGPNPNGALKEWNGASLETITDTDVWKANVGSQWPQFAITYKQLTGKNVIGVFSGSGGAEWYPNGDLNNWAPSPDGNRYDGAKGQAQYILNNYGASKLRGVFIILGINDARGTQTIPNIKSGMDSLITRINNDMGTPPIYLVQIGRSESSVNGGFTSRVRDVQKLIDNSDAGHMFNDGGQYGIGLAQRYSNVRVVDHLERYVALGYYSADNLHLTQAGNNYLGDYLARKITT